MRSLDHQGPAAPQCRADSRRQPSARPSRCSPPTSPTQYLAALRNRCFSSKALLRRPGGLEGFVPVGQLVPNDLPVPNGEDAANLRIDVRAAGSPARPNPAQRDHGLPRVDDSVDPDRGLLKGIEEAHPGSECLGPDGVCIRVGQPGRAEHHLTMVVVQLPSAFPLVPLPVLQDLAHDSTFSSNIAHAVSGHGAPLSMQTAAIHPKHYSDSLAASMASSRVKYSRPVAILPSRIVKRIA